MSENKTPEIRLVEPFLLAGIHIPTSLAANQTFALWSKFMPQVKHIHTREGNELYSVEIYQNEAFDAFTPETRFEKWAAVKVHHASDCPPDLKILPLEGGLYAIFIHYGLHTAFHKTFQYIFREWLPQSPYEADSRPHIEVMGSKYKNNDPASEEEIWVPIKLRKH